MRFRGKKNLTEINHKVSVFAKWFRRALPLNWGDMVAPWTPLYRQLARQAGRHVICTVGTWAGSHARLEQLGSSIWPAIGLAAAPAGLAGQVAAPLRRRSASAAANCPYALFDLRFQDDGHWRARLQSHGHLADRGRIRGRCGNRSTSCGWRCSMPGTSPRAHGSGRTAAARHERRHRRRPFAASPSTSCRRWRPRRRQHLTARWSGCTAYWSALTAAAARADSEALRRVQLHGLQLAPRLRLAGP